MKTKTVYTVNEKLDYYRNEYVEIMKRLNFVQRRIAQLSNDEIEIWKKDFREALQAKDKKKKAR